MNVLDILYDIECYVVLQDKNKNLKLICYINNAQTNVVCTIKQYFF